MNFCPPAVPRSGTGGEKRFRNSTLAECQNRKIFFSLIEKIFAGARLKKCIENFSVLLGGSEADAVRKRWVGLSPIGRQSNISIRILFKIGSNFVQKTPPFYDFDFLRRYCLALASLNICGAGRLPLRIKMWTRWESNPHSPLCKSGVLPLNYWPPN